MALMSSTEPLSQPDQKTLLLTAARSIAHGLRNGAALPIVLSQFPPSLAAQRATFVTLTINTELRGCIGTLEAYRPLIEDVAANAHAAAFRDPRFYPLSQSEYPLLDIHISVLSEPEPMKVESEADLIAQIRPQIDGLILEDGARRGTFLPSVWESLPDPREFLAHLKHKAGLPLATWPSTLRVWRYTTFSFGALVTQLEQSAPTPSQQATR